MSTGDRPRHGVGDPGRAPRVFYGWYVLAASFAILFLNTGGRYLIGVLVKPMAEEFGWSRSAISGVVFLNLAVYALATIIAGRLYDRFGPKWVIAVSTLLFSAGFALMATMDSLWQFHLYYGVLAAAGLGGITVPLFGSLIGNWFERRRGLAVSLAFAGSCLGQFFLVPVFSDMVLTFGWRTTNLWIAGLSLAVNLPLAFGVIRGDPEALGLLPYGAETQEPPSAAAERSPTAGLGDLTLSEAMRSRSLWLFTVVMFVCGSADFLVTTHLVAMVTDYGLSPNAGASMLAWLGLLSLGGILLAGPAADVIGNKIPIVVTFALRIVLFALLFSVKGPTAFWVFSLGFGLTLLVTAPLTPTMLGTLYGVTHLGFISGFIVMAHTLGGGVWTYIGGVIFDRTGNYDLALIISAALSVVALVCTLFIREERHRRREPRKPRERQRPGQRRGSRERRDTLEPDAVLGLDSSE
jgi:MFS family permease